MMQGAGIFGLFRTIGVITIIGVLLIWIITVFSAIGHGASTGEWSPLLYATGGKILGIDQRLGNSVDVLNNQEAYMAQYPEVYNTGTIQLVRQSIFYDMILLIIIFVVLYKLGNWALGLNQFSPRTDILLIIGIIVFFAVMEMSYTYFVSHEFIIPLSGVYKVFANIKTVIGIPEGLVTISTSNIPNYTSQTINQTLNVSEALNTSSNLTSTTL